MSARLILKPGKERSLERRHPWLYAQAVNKIQGKPVAGDTVEILAADGRWLAVASYSPDSAIVARAWSFVSGTTIDDAWISQKVKDAVARRESLRFNTDAIRLIFGEADGLPGIIADQYADYVVLQLLSAGADRWRAAIAAALKQATGCRAVFERSDGAARTREKLEPQMGPLIGDAPAEPIAIQEYGLNMLVDPVKGHKTGHYIDQRDNRYLCGQLAQGRDVLNLFSYTGGFSVAALRNGARRVVSVDSSADAMALAQQHARINGIFPGEAEWVTADAFDTLKRFLAEQQRFDLIILDPPKFAPSYRHVDKAARAYKEINLKALKLLRPGGYLMTYSCSGAIDVDLFQKIVAGAVFDARVDCQMLRRLGAGEDHPTSMTHPEGEYLKGLLLRAM